MACMMTSSPLWQAIQCLIQSRQLLLIPHLLSPSACQEWLSELQLAESETAEAEFYQGHSPRQTALLKVSAELEKRAIQLFEPLAPAFTQHFGKAYTRHERPQFLKYQQGDHFRAHRDRSQAEVYNQRALSLILFLNDHQSQPGFRGGRLSFLLRHPDATYSGNTDQAERLQGVPIPPQQGMLVAFDPDLLHEVSPVTAGERYTLVTWLAE